MCKISFFVYNEKKIQEIINEEHFLWNKFLPITKSTLQLSSDKCVSRRITYGTYFKIAFIILKKNNFKLLFETIKYQKKGSSVHSISGVESIFIFLEKHGAYYHPARVKTSYNGKIFSFALNLAISDIGTRCIKKEVKALKFLEKRMPFRYTLKVYSSIFDIFILDYRVSVFTSEWLYGYQEFHLFGLRNYINKEKGNLVVWDYNVGNYLVASKIISEIYFQISMILCSYYDLISARQIFPWHNASGDFIIKMKNSCIDVRLISARSFDSMFLDLEKKNKIYSEREVFYQLLIFFLHISIRVRLDRLCGTGDLVLLDKSYIYSIVNGLFQGLDNLIIIYNFPQDFPDFFKIYILDYQESSLKNMLSQVIFEVYHKELSGRSVILSSLNEHIFYFKKAVMNLI